jgi:hypothetical protein
MESIQQLGVNLSANEIDQCIEMGNNAIRHGNEEESMNWYIKGLARARELCNLEMENYISSLMITLI